MSVARDALPIPSHRFLHRSLHRALRWHYPAVPFTAGTLPRLGLDLGPDHIRLAVARRRGQHLQIVALSEHRFAQPICWQGPSGQLGDLDLITRSCRTLLRQHGIGRGLLCTAVPAGAALQWQLTLPASSPAHARLAQVRADAMLRHGAAIEQASLDYRVLDPMPGQARVPSSELQVQVACIPSLLADDRLALAGALGLRAGPISLQEQVSTALLRPQAGDGAVLHLGQHATWLVPPGTQSLHPLRWHTSHDIGTLLLEVATWLQPPPPRLLLSGERPAPPGLASAFARYAGIAVEHAALPSSLHITATDHARWPGPDLRPFHAAIALAANGTPP